MELEVHAEPDWLAEERANPGCLPGEEGSCRATDASWPDEWAGDDDPATDWVDAYEL